MKKFGTDGIRAKADEFTPELIGQIVKGLVEYAGSDIKVLVGGDTRESSEWILADFEAALETFGIEYSNVGILPTPAINYCFYEMGFDFAIDVTASHNPYTDNGIKIFERGKKQGRKLGEKGRKTIEAAIAEGKVYDFAAPSLRESLHSEAVYLYKEHLLDYIDEADFSGLKIGMDCANGATSVIGSSVFEKLGASVKLINCEPNYTRSINEKCGSTHLETLQKLVSSEGLDYGIAFDGDGDRVLMINKAGAEVDGDEMLAILAKNLNLPAVAITVMANQGLFNWLNDNNIHAEITAVGDANVLAAMMEKNIKLGGEQSGHIILPGEPTGDGMLTALAITKIIASEHKTLDELASIMMKYPQVIVNMAASAEQKENLNSDAAKQILTEFEKEAKKPSGRILVRPSGTEELIRITVWGNDENEIEKLAQNLKTKLEEVL